MTWGDVFRVVVNIIGAIIIILGLLVGAGLVVLHIFYSFMR